MDARTDQPRKDGYYDNIVDALRYAVVPIAQPSRHLFEGKPLPKLWRVV